MSGGRVVGFWGLFWNLELACFMGLEVEVT